MHTKKKFLVVLAALFTLIFSQMALAQTSDPLPSWNECQAKQAIIGLVQSVTHEGSPDFVPIQERIATFDNDGTLWSEQPVYFQFFFIADRIKSLTADHPEWKSQEPYASLIKGDFKQALAGGKKSLMELIMAASAGVTDQEFEGLVKKWIGTAKHPETHMLFTEMIYEPMLEVLSYLWDNGFKTYIVTGGGIEFVRAWSERVYGIPPEQVIGSSIKTKYEVKEGRPVLMRLPEENFVDDGPGKPVGINQFIGRRPVIAFGNSDGDYQMLEWTTSAPGKRLGFFVHHTDAKREWAYDRDSKIGRLAKGLDDAKKNGWILIDMKDDWKVIYPSQ